MKPRGCAATLDDLARVYPDNLPEEQLAQAYRVQLRRILQELAVLMQHSRTRMAKGVYERERAGHRLLEVWLVTEPTDVHALEWLLKHLLAQQRASARLPSSGSSPVEAATRA